jgi:hypothetical protein
MEGFGRAGLWCVRRDDVWGDRGEVSRGLRGQRPRQIQLPVSRRRVVPRRGHPLGANHHGAGAKRQHPHRNTPGHHSMHLRLFHGLELGPVAVDGGSASYADEAHAQGIWNEGGAIQGRYPGSFNMAWEGECGQTPRVHFGSKWTANHHCWVPRQVKQSLQFAFEHHITLLEGDVSRLLGARRPVWPRLAQC